MSSGFVGSPNLQTSTANQELVGQEAGWTSTYNFKEFSFMNDQDCHVKINGGTAIFLRASQGFSSNANVNTIGSFIIVDSSINFNFLGAY